MGINLIRKSFTTETQRKTKTFVIPAFAGTTILKILRLA
jgi:hypothetical protein